MNAQTCAKVSSQLKSLGGNNLHKLVRVQCLLHEYYVCLSEKGKKERNCPCHIVRPMFLI